MPAISKSGPSLFLGIELATDQFRASIVDESLELVGVECVDFDTELSEYQCVFSRPFPFLLSVRFPPPTPNPPPPLRLLLPASRFFSCFVLLLARIDHLRHRMHTHFALSLSRALALCFFSHTERKVGSLRPPEMPTLRRWRCGSKG